MAFPVIKNINSRQKEAATMPQSGGQPQNKLLKSCVLPFISKGDRRHEGAPGMQFYEEEKQLSTPVQPPSALEFPREEGHNGVRELELPAGLHEQFHEG